MGDNGNKTLQKIKTAIKMFITQTLVHVITVSLPYILIAVILLQ